MELNGSTKTNLLGVDVAEDSATTVEIKIKTLDSQTYTLRVNKCVPVPALKEQIATVTGVLSEQQRLICRGKVLKDDQLLSAYHVEDGHTLHLVVRQPHHSSSSPSTSYMGSEGALDHPAASDSARNRGNHVARSFVFETVNMDQGDIDTSVISRIISSVLDSIGTTTGSGNPRIDLREMNSERFARPSNDAGQGQPNPTTGNVEFGRRQAPFPFPPTAPLGNQNPTVIPDSLTTLHQFLGFMRDEFRRQGFVANGREHGNNAEAAGLHRNEGQGGLPSPASLAEAVLSTRQLLMEHAAECLAQLARQLEDHTSMTDAAARMNIQSTAVRSAYFMQNLGSLLLELGRTTMTLRMGQSPAEAFVNAGPALFISASGPNPMMVQLVPFHPGSNPSGVHMGTVNSGLGPEGEQLDSPFIPRNIEVRIRTVGRAVPVTTGNGGEQAGAQQPQDPLNTARNSSGPNVVHQAFSGVTGGESGVRVVPIRTVVAIPTGVHHSSSDSSGNAVGLVYPVLARFRPRSTSNTSDTRGSQASNDHRQDGSQVDQQSIPDSAVQRQNLESNSGGSIRDDNQFSANTVPSVPGNRTANEPAEYLGSSRIFASGQQTPSGNTINDGQQTNQVPMAQILSTFNQFFNTIFPGGQVNSDGINRPDSVADAATEQIGTATNAEMQGPAGVDNDQGVFFSNLLRQVMPHIAQGSTLEPGVLPTNPSSAVVPTEGGNLNDSSSSQHRRDPPESPNAKRPKRENN